MQESDELKKKAAKTLKDNPELAEGVATAAGAPGGGQAVQGAAAAGASQDKPNSPKPPTEENINMEAAQDGAEIGKKLMSSIGKGVSFLVSKMTPSPDTKSTSSLSPENTKPLQDAVEKTPTSATPTAEKEQEQQVKPTGP